MVGEIAAGLLLGPSCFGYFFPGVSAAIFDPAVAPVFEVLSQLGLILLLFVVGLEFNFSHLHPDGKAALGISLTGVALPFVLGLALAVAAHRHLELSHLGRPLPLLGFALFMGVAMSITAIPVLARIMMELNLTRTRIGAMTISAAAVDDACGSILLATISGIVEARFQILRSLEMIAGTVGFFLLMLLAARPLLKAFVRGALRQGRGELGLGSLAVILVLLLLSALATSLIGIFAIFGEFLLGTMLSDELDFREVIRRRLRDFLTVFFLPIFFTYTGLRTNVGGLDHLGPLAAAGGRAGGGRRGQARRLCVGGPAGRRPTPRGVSDRRDDEHPRPDGAGGDQRRPGPGRDSRQRLLHVGVDGPFHHGDDRSLALTTCPRHGTWDFLCAKSEFLARGRKDECTL